jgi:DNA gyrase subunit A
MDETNQEQQEPQAVERIEPIQIVDEMKTSYLNYAMSVLVARALPDVRDGLKPSQRRILVAMNDLGLGPRSKHRKCAKIVGDTSGNYHPHGDQATYGTLVRMGQDWNMRTTLVDPQGNFGSIDNDPPAAMRYTEARMTAAAVDMLEDLKQDTVDFVPNYDETRTEPTVLPAKFPNLLVNGATGIAVGMATNLAPHNVSEVCEALLLMMMIPTADSRIFLKSCPGRIFRPAASSAAARGLWMPMSAARAICGCDARLMYESPKKGRENIIITEIPYMTVKSAIVSKIADCVHEGHIDEISDVRDESDRQGMRIVVELKKDIDSQVVLNKLYRFTPLQSTFAIQNVALVNNRPEMLTSSRCCSITSTIVLWSPAADAVPAEKYRQRAHILEGLILAVSDIDEIINLIKSSPDAPTAKERLMKKPLRLVESQTLRKILPEVFFTEKSASDQYLSSQQADAILTMQLQRLTGLEIEKLAKEYAEIFKQINECEELLASRKLQLDIIKADLEEIKKKFSTPRRTELAGEEAEDINMEDLIADEETIVTISHAGYIKRTPMDAYKKQGRGGKGVIGSDTKEGDFLEHLFAASTHDYLLFFTSKGICHWLKVYNIPELSRQSKGRNIVNLIQIGADEKITSILAVREFDDKRQLMMATAKGNVKKTVLSAYGNPRSSGLIAIKLEEGDSLIGAAITSGQDEVILGTADGMAIRFHEEQVRSMGRASIGVVGIKLREGDEVVSMVIVEQGASLLTVCEKGYGKRTDLDDYRPQNRGGLGLINIKTTDRNGRVVAIKAVHDNDELMMITANGMIIRTGLEQVREIGRNTAGVRMIRMDDDDNLVAAERLIVEDDGSDKTEADNRFT